MVHLIIEHVINDRNIIIKLYLMLIAIDLLYRMYYLKYSSLIQRGI